MIHQTPYEQGYSYYLLGLERLYKSDFQKAEQYLKKAVEARPNNPTYLANLAEALAHLGYLDEAQNAFARAEAMEPDNYFVLSSKFNFYHDMLKDRQAEEDTLARMLPLSNSPHKISWNLARFHEKYEEFQEAYSYYVKAVMAKPGDKATRSKLRELELKGYAGDRAMSKEQLFEHVLNDLNRQKESHSDKDTKPDTDIYADRLRIGPDAFHFVRTPMYQNNFTIMLPDDFKDMPGDQMVLKYPQEKGRPQVVKTDYSTQINFAFKYYDYAFTEDMVKPYVSKTKGKLEEIVADTAFFDCRYRRSKAGELIGFFDFVHVCIDDDLYNVFAFMPVKGNMLHIIFNCPYDLMEQWQPVVVQVLASVQGV
jgi:tetratricopeptide (TPR) repeat protein